MGTFRTRKSKTQFGMRTTTTSSPTRGFTKSISTGTKVCRNTFTWLPNGQSRMTRTFNLGHGTSYRETISSKIKKVPKRFQGYYYNPIVNQIGTFLISTFIITLIMIGIFQVLYQHIGPYLL